MNAFTDGFCKQIYRTFAVRRYILMLLMFLAAAWICMDVYRDLVVKDVPVAVLDYDNSSLSRTIILHLSASRELKIVRTPIYSVEDAQDLLIKGEITGIVLLPSDLSKNLKKGKRAEVLAAFDMSNILLGKNAFKAVKTVIGTVAAGAQLTLVRKLGERKERVMAAVAPITIDGNFTFNPAANYVIYLVPGLVMFFLHVYLIMLAAVPFLSQDEKSGFVKRLGEFTAIFVTGMLMGWLLFYVVLPYVSVYPYSSFWMVSAHLACFVLLDILLMISFMIFIADELKAFQLVVILAMLSLMFSGITWPSDMFPDWIDKTSWIIPFTPFAKSFQMFLHYPVEVFETNWIFRIYIWQALGFIGVIILGKMKNGIKQKKHKHEEVSA